MAQRKYRDQSGLRNNRFGLFVDAQFAKSSAELAGGTLPCIRRCANFGGSEGGFRRECKDRFNRRDAEKIQRKTQRHKTAKVG